MTERTLSPCGRGSTPRGLRRPARPGRHRCVRGRCRRTDPRSQGLANGSARGRLHRAPYRAGQPQHARASAAVRRRAAREAFGPSRSGPRNERSDPAARVPVPTVTARYPPALARAQRERESDPSRGDVAPGLRQQPQDCEDPLIDARQPADDELAAQPLHLIGEALVQRRDEPRDTSRRSEELVAEYRHTHRGRRAKRYVVKPRRRGVVALNERSPGPSS